MTAKNLEKHILGPLLLALVLACGGRSHSSVDTPPAPAPRPAPPLPDPPSPLIGIHGWYLTQAVQRLDRSVPLIARRDAVLRVFLKAGQANAAHPEVRVTILNGAAAWHHTITATRASVPTAFSETDLPTSWNVAVPGQVILPGARVRLEVDPEHHWSGVDPAARRVEAALDVRVVPILRITLIPVHQLRTGRTGEVVGPGRTLASWGDVLRKVLPVGELDLKVGAPLSTTADLDDPDPSHDTGWFQLLGELQQRRYQDWAAGDPGRLVYGVVKRGHSYGTLGMTPVQSSEAAGWDEAGVYAFTFAHEIGHALGRAHAPFNLPAGEPLGDWPAADPGYAQAGLGAVGLDVETLAIKAPDRYKDIMSYAPTDRYWVSDHTFRKVMDWLVHNPTPDPPPLLEAPSAGDPRAARRHGQRLVSHFAAGGGGTLWSLRVEVSN